MIRRKMVKGEAPEGGGGLLLVGADLLEDGQHLAHHVGEGDGGRGHHDAGQGEDDADAMAGQPVAPPPGLAVDEDEGDAHHHRRDGQGQVDEGVEEPRPGEPVAGQDEGHAHAEDRVERARR